MAQIDLPTERAPYQLCATLQIVMGDLGSGCLPQADGHMALVRRPWSATPPVDSVSTGTSSDI